jgi:hypothetical protein
LQPRELAPFPCAVDADVAADAVADVVEAADDADAPEAPLDALFAEVPGRVLDVFWPSEAGADFVFLSDIAASALPAAAAAAAAAAWRWRGLEANRHVFAHARCVGCRTWCSESGRAREWERWKGEPAEVGSRQCNGMSTETVDGN